MNTYLENITITNHNKHFTVISFLFHFAIYFVIIFIYFVTMIFTIVKQQTNTPHYTLNYNQTTKQNKDPVKTNTFNNNINHKEHRCKAIKKNGKSCKQSGKSTQTGGPIINGYCKYHRS